MNAQASVKTSMGFRVPHRNGIVLLDAESQGDDVMVTTGWPPSYVGTGFRDTRGSGTFVRKIKAQ